MTTQDRPDASKNLPKTASKIPNLLCGAQFLTLQLLIRTRLRNMPSRLSSARGTGGSVKKGCQPHKAITG